MISRQARNTATALMAQLPPIPEPWSMDTLCQRLLAQRGRALVLHSLNLPALPFGLWYDDGKCDHIIYHAGIIGYHRDHIILHEVCHMLAKHNAVDQQALWEDENYRDDLISRLAQRAMRSRYADFQEEIAEIFATNVLRLAKNDSSVTGSDFERRAAAIFGID